MSIIPEDEELKELYRKERYADNAWTHKENVFKNRPNARNQFLAKHIVSFNKAINEIFRRSFFGTFLRYFNPQQNQDKDLNEDKLAIWNYYLKYLEPAERKALESRNTFTEGFKEMFLEAIKSRDVIDWDYIYEKIQTLRILSYEINVLDKRMKSFKHLQILVLSGNWITDLDGKNLPRRLIFLELYANQIKKLCNLCTNAPKCLKYLGLGRNCLHDHSGYHHFFKSNNFRQLKCLDLSNNDVYDLAFVANQLSQLHNLRALSLEGNPCWVNPLYKSIVVRKLHFLNFLDNMEFLDTDKVIDNERFELLSDVQEPALVFHCFRIISLPPPPKQKGAQHFFHVEVSLPLLEEITIEPEISKSEKNVSAISAKKAKSKSTTKTAKSSKKGKRVPDIYDGPDEKGMSSKIKNKNFKTERKTWDKTIVFPEVIVKSPENDMRAIRDCFRSRINVKVIYQLIEPPQKAKKGKKEKKGKKGKKGKDTKKDKKGKGKKGLDKETSKTESTTKKDVVEKEPEETILKKITIANFFCDLRPVNWSDTSVDFYWANHPDANPIAISVEGSLNALNYQAKVSGKSKGKADSKDGKKTGKKSNATTTKEESTKTETEINQTDETRVSKIGEIEPIGFPSIFTCHVGFGLNRCHSTIDC